MKFDEKYVVPNNRTYSEMDRVVLISTPLKHKLT